MPYHYTPIRMATILKTDDTTPSTTKDVDQSKLPYIAGGNVNW